PSDAWVAGRWRQVELDERMLTVRVPPGTALDLGGIAKGMAVDAALADLAATGVAYAAVDAGGDLAVFGELPGKAGWPIAVDGLAGAVAISHGGLATSSVLRRRWRAGGRERHHLLDARFGLPAEGDLLQVTISAASCRQAEVAAKVALLSTADEATAFVLRHGLAAAFVTRDGDVLRVGDWQ
ncbi:MAG TPA: FAD:protein FMN transferase, partial [Candidatus Limnocylindria bacterium]